MKVYVVVCEQHYATPPHFMVVSVHRSRKAAEKKAEESNDYAVDEFELEDDGPTLDDHLRAGNELMAAKANGYETDEFWCTHCGRDTQQKYRTPHERDSSNDYFECLTCGWIRTGHADEYEAPSA